LAIGVLDVFVPLVSSFSLTFFVALTLTNIRSPNSRPAECLHSFQPNTSSPHQFQSSSSLLFHKLPPSHLVSMRHLGTSLESLPVQLCRGHFGQQPSQPCCGMLSSVDGELGRLIRNIPSGYS
jgi:hypothetical protein